VQVNFNDVWIKAAFKSLTGAATMASPKSGSAGSAVAPAEPVAAAEALDEASGAKAAAEAAKLERASNTYKKKDIKPYKPPVTPEEAAIKTSWIEIELVDLADKPVAGEGYEIELPDGTVASGTLDPKGFARVEGIEPGTCKIRFPRLDRRAWERI